MVAEPGKFRVQKNGIMKGQGKSSIAKGGFKKECDVLLPNHNFLINLIKSFEPCITECSNMVLLDSFCLLCL